MICTFNGTHLLSLSHLTHARVSKPKGHYQLLIMPFYDQLTLSLFLKSTSEVLKKTIKLLLQSVIPSIIVFMGFDALTTSQKDNVVNILFIGNSYTYENDGVDQHLNALLNSSSDGKVIYRYVASAAEGKYHLMTHWYDDETRDLFSSRRWDKVVMQEYNSGPLKTTEEFNIFAKCWERLIKKTNEDTEIYLFSTWKYSKSKGMEDRLYSAYDELSSSINAEVVPVGHLWKSLEGKINLYDEDGAHPNRKGTFLTACLFYEQMFGDDVTKTKNTDEILSRSMQSKLKKWAHDFNESARVVSAQSEN